MSNEDMINSLDITDNSSETVQPVKRCESHVLDAKTLNECSSKSYIPMGRTGPIIAKVPVVLSDIEVQIDVESEIKLQEAALDIKTVDKHVYLTQCKLIPLTNKLFIAGYVQKNIQYSTIDCVNKNSVSGNIQHTTICVPFKCVTKVKLSQEPIYGKEYKKRLNSLDKDMMSKDDQEDSWIHYNKMYEPIFCELEHAKILETDIFKDPYSSKDCQKDERVIQNIVEKMVIYLRLKVLQNQQICIPEPDGEVVIMQKYDSNSDYDYYENEEKDKKNSNIEVGFDPDKGMIGKEVHYNDYNED